MDMVDGRPTWLRASQPFLFGGLAGCAATSCIQPIDMVKVRIQLADSKGAERNPFRVARGIVTKEGFLGLYKGLDAGIVRQLTYSTSRLGLFRVFSEKMKDSSGEPLPLYKKSIAALTAGGLASLVGNPADLSLIRMQADATLPPNQRRNYKGVLDACRQISAQEGVIGLWRGCTPTVLRAMSLNLGMLASHDQAKESLAPLLGTGWTNTLASSLVSGFFAVTFSLPFDFIKTRMQKMKADPVTGKLPYSGVIDCAKQVAAKEGIGSFFAGYSTYYFRIAPHAVITLVSLEVLQNCVRSVYYTPAP